MLSISKQRDLEKTVSDLVERVNILSKISGRNGISVVKGRSGIQLLGGGISKKTEHKIFEVQEAAGEGVYNCYEQTLDSTDWTDTSGARKTDGKNETDVEVLNLCELDPRPDFVPALAKFDYLEARKWLDDEGKSRWVGIPVMTSVVRRAKTRAAAAATETISCNLYNYSQVEMTTGLGSNISVICNTNGGGNLNVSVPLLKDNQNIFVFNVQGRWWSTIHFNTGQTAVAYVKTTPGATIALSCWFSETDGTGQTISVICMVAGHTNLNAATPRFVDGQKILVTKNGATWGMAGYQASEDCDCYSA